MEVDGGDEEGGGGYNFFLKKSLNLFACYGINTTIKSWFMEPPVKIYGVLRTCHSRFVTGFCPWLFPYNYVIPCKTENDPLSIQYDV